MKFALLSLSLFLSSLFLLDSRLEAAKLPIEVLTTFYAGNTSDYNRSDRDNVIDGDPDTWSYVTVAGTLASPQWMIFELGDEPRQINRIRVSKIGDTDGGGTNPVDPMDVQIYYSVDTGSIRDRNYVTLSGAKSGFMGTENIEATSVSANGFIDNDIHDRNTHSDFYSISFDTVDATTIALRVNRDSVSQAAWLHYPMYEFEAHYEPLLSQQIQIESIGIFRADNVPIGRGDEQAAIDNDLTTGSYLTPSGNLSPFYIRLDLGNTPKQVSRLRIHKAGDIDGLSGTDHSDLEIYYTTDTGSFSNLALQSVSGLRSGSLGEEVNRKAEVWQSGQIKREHHNSDQDGFYSLTFNEITATSIIIRVQRSAGEASFTHYFSREFQVLYQPDLPQLIQPTGIAVFDLSGNLTNRGDEGEAIDGNPATWGFLTPSGTNGKRRVAFDFNGLTDIDQIRVAKIGDINAGGSSAIDNAHLKILYTRDTGPLESRNYRTVTGLTNGYKGIERINADSVGYDGTVTNDHHNFADDSWYRLVFNEIEATALAIEFETDDAAENPVEHYPLYEFQALISSGGNLDHTVSDIAVMRADNKNLINRGDEHLAIDGQTETHSALTPSFTDTPAIVAFDLGSTAKTVNRIRVAKIGDFLDSALPNQPDPMRLQILYTTDTSTLEARTYQPVTGLLSGFGGSEGILAGRVSPDGIVREDIHNFNTNGYFSLSFEEVNATALAIQFSREDTFSPWVHYPIYNFQAIYEANAFNPSTLPTAGSVKVGKVINVDFGNGGAYQGADAAGNASPLWNHSGISYIDSILDSEGNPTDLTIQFAHNSGTHTTDWTSNSLLQDFWFKNTYSDAWVDLQGLNPNRLYTIYIYTGVEGGSYQIDETRKTITYDQTGIDADPDYANGPPTFVEDQNYVRFSSVRPDFNGAVRITYHRPNNLVNGNIAGVTIQELSSVLNPIHGDIGSASINAYQGPSVLNEGNPVWNHLPSAITTQLLDAAGIQTQVNVGFYFYGNPENPFTTSWSDDDLLEDFYYRDNTQPGKMVISNLPLNQEFDLYLYTGVEGGLYWYGNTFKFALYDGTGTGNDPYYAESPPWKEGKNYVRFRKVRANTEGEVTIYWQNNPNFSGANGNLSGFTLVPTGTSSSPNPDFGEIINIDIGGDVIYSGADPLGNILPNWNRTDLYEGAVDITENFFTVMRQPSAISTAFYSASGFGTTSWTSNELLFDHYYKSSGQAVANINGLDPNSLYNLFVYTGVEGGQYAIGGTFRSASYSATGINGSPAYANGPPDFVENQNYVLFQGTSPNASGNVRMDWSVNDLSGNSNGNLAGLTIQEITPLTNPVHIDIQPSASSLLYNGPSAIYDRSPFWNAFFKNQHYGLKDSGGNLTSVGLRGANANGNIWSTWSSHPLLNDFLWEDGGGNAFLEVIGLHQDQSYDIYIYTGVEGGIYKINEQEISAAYSGKDLGGDPDYEIGATWKEGKNYVVFQNLIPNPDGTIFINYRPNPASLAPTSGDFAGLSIVPTGTPKHSGTSLNDTDTGEILSGGNYAQPVDSSSSGNDQLPRYNRASLSFEDYLSGNFDPGIYETIEITGKALDSVGLAAIELNNVVLKIKGWCAEAEGGVLNFGLVKAALYDIRCDPLADYEFTGRAALQLPFAGAVAEFKMGLFKNPQIVIVGGQFNVAKDLKIGNTFVLKKLGVTIDPSQQRYGGEALVGLSGKFKNGFTPAHCPNVGLGAKAFGAGVYFKDGAIQEISITGANLQHHLEFNPSIVFNSVNFTLYNPESETDWGFRGTAVFGIGCPIPNKLNLNSVTTAFYPFSIEGQVAYNAPFPDPNNPFKKVSSGPGNLQLIGTGRFFDIPLGKVFLEMNFNGKGDATLGAELSVPFYKALASISITPNGYSGTAKGTVSIPDWLGGGVIDEHVASFTDNGIVGSFPISRSTRQQNCSWTGGNTIAWPYPCGTFWEMLRGKTCYTYTTNPLTQVCNWVTDVTSVNVYYRIRGTDVGISVSSFRSTSNGWISESIQDPIIDTNSSSAVSLLTNFRKLDEIVYENSQSEYYSDSSYFLNLEGSTSSFGTSSNAPTTTATEILEITEDLPGALFSINFENTITELNFELTLPDGSKTFVLSEGLLPLGFADSSAFSTLDLSNKTGFIYLENPPMGSYSVKLENSAALGSYTLELLGLNPELGIQIVEVREMSTEGIYEIDYIASDPQNIGEVRIMFGSNRTGDDAITTGIVDVSDGVGTVSVDLNEWQIPPGYYYFALVISDEVREPSVSIAEKPIFINYTNAPTPITEIFVIEGDSSLSVTWEAPDEENILEYLVLYSDGNNQNQQLLFNSEYVDASKRSLTLTDLENGVPYLLTVVAVDFDSQESAPIRLVRGIPSRGFGLNPPIILTEPKENIQVGDEYFYIPRFYDSDTALANPDFLGTEEDETLDGSPYLWIIETGPAGMTIDEVSGLIKWTPTEDQIGMHDITISLHEITLEGIPGLRPEDVFFDDQSFQIEVHPEGEYINTKYPYEFFSIPPYSVKRGETYRYDPLLIAPLEGVTLELMEGPETMKLVDGVITWTPIESEYGAQTRIKATTSNGIEFEQFWYLDVREQLDIDATIVGKFSLGSDEFTSEEGDEINILINRTEGSLASVDLVVALLDEKGQVLATQNVTMAQGVISEQIDLLPLILENELPEVGDYSIRLDFGSGVPDGATLGEQIEATLYIKDIGDGSAKTTLPDMFYPGESFTVNIDVIPYSNVETIYIYDIVPYGWTVTNISHEGVFNSGFEQVFWGPIDADEPFTVSYDITPSFGAEGFASFQTVVLMDESEIISTGRSYTVNSERYQKYESLDTIYISPNGPSTPYPSTLDIQSEFLLEYPPLVAVKGLKHEYYNDLNFLLVGPSGENVVLTGNTQLYGTLDPIDILYSDNGYTPYFGYEEITTGVFLPINESPFYSLPEPSPAAPYGEELTLLSGGFSRGSWNLYVMDSVEEDGGIIEGWDLFLPTLHAGHIAQDLIKSYYFGDVPYKNYVYVEEYGYFYIDSSGWTFHEDFGWIRPLAAIEDSFAIWFYSPTYGWTYIDLNVPDWVWTEVEGWLSM